MLMNGYRELGPLHRAKRVWVIAKGLGYEARAKQTIFMVFLLAVLYLLLGPQGIADAQSVSDAPPAVPSPAMVNSLIDVALTIIGGAMVKPVTAILQTWHVTAKVDAKTIAAILATLFVGVQGYANGVYGHGPMAIWYALLASFVAFTRSYGNNKALTNAAGKGAAYALATAPSGSKG